jgi:hypothetical protein
VGGAGDQVEDGVREAGDCGRIANPPRLWGWKPFLRTGAAPTKSIGTAAQRACTTLDLLSRRAPSFSQRTDSRSGEQVETFLMARSAMPGGEGPAAQPSSPRPQQRLNPSIQTTSGNHNRTLFARLSREFYEEGSDRGAFPATAKRGGRSG